MEENKQYPIDYAEVTFSLDGHYDDSALVRTINASDVARHIEQMYVDYNSYKMSYEVTSTCIARHNSSALSSTNRGVKITSRLCECDFTDEKLSDDKMYAIWSNQFVETVSGLMIYLSNATVFIYFHGRYDRVVPVHLKNLKPEPAMSTC